MQVKILKLTEHKYFKNFILALLVLNAITLGLETTKDMSDKFYITMHRIDLVILYILTTEVTLRIMAHNLAFFKRSWNIFDFVITAIALIPAAGPFAVIRALRVLRVFRIFSAIPRLQKVINTIVHSIPGILSILGVVLIIFYVFAVIGTNLFYKVSPMYFDNIGGSMFTLFQMMTGGGWAPNIARPIMEIMPYAWVYFVSFILITTIILLKVIIVILMTSMHSETTKTKNRANDSKEFDPTKLRNKNIDV